MHWNNLVCNCTAIAQEESDIGSYCCWVICNPITKKTKRCFDAHVYALAGTLMFLGHGNTTMFVSGCWSLYPVCRCIDDHTKLFSIKPPSRLLIYIAYIPDRIIIRISDKCAKNNLFTFFAAFPLWIHFLSHFKLHTATMRFRSKDRWGMHGLGRQTNSAI